MMQTNLSPEIAIDYAKSMGLLMLNKQGQLDHIPFALAPSPFPKPAFKQALQLADDFAVLMPEVANDSDFLTDILARLGDADPFSQALGKLYRQVYIDSQPSQTMSLGIWRSDYLVDKNLGLRQVEINLIASAFPAFASRISRLHRWLYPNLSPQLPENAAFDETIQGFVQAWQAYGREDACICFVQQLSERNRFDQLALAQALSEHFGIRSLFKTLPELAAEASLRGERLYLGADEIAVVYFRACYVPDDFSHESIWAVRLLLEQSAAIKCPSLPYQLSGMKLVQQQLTRPEVLKQFVPADVSARLQACFMPFLGLDEDISAALAEPHAYVLKPQREGGGHNLYGEAWPTHIKQLSAQQQQAWVLMRLIDTQSTNNQLLMQGEVFAPEAVISELGIYQSCLLDGNHCQSQQSGHLLRSKFAHNQEGGIAAGFAALDSPLLI